MTPQDLITLGFSKTEPAAYKLSLKNNLALSVRFFDNHLQLFLIQKKSEENHIVLHDEQLDGNIPDNKIKQIIKALKK